MAKGNIERKRLSSHKRNKGKIENLLKWKTKNTNLETATRNVISSFANNRSHPESRTNLQETDQTRSLETVVGNSSPSFSNHSSDDIFPESDYEPTNQSNNREEVVDSSSSSCKDSDLETAEMTGNRIVDVTYFLQQLRQIGEHSKIGCTFSNLVLHKEVRHGLISKFFLKCNFCNGIFSLDNVGKTSREENINSAAVNGIMAIGGGFFNLEEFLGCLQIPSMSDKTYQKYHENVANEWQQSAHDMMKKAAEEEAEHAKKINSVDEEGCPLVAVVADGCWSKRSYGTKYSALSGAAAIIGQHTGKVLYLGVKNKFCSICVYSKNNIKPHKCTKNHVGSSSSMEADIIAEGFSCSESMHGIKYHMLIGDGDSSTYKKIIEKRPYKNLTVEKVECRNHLLRNFCKKLRNVVADRHYNIQERKLLEGRIMRLRAGIKGAIKHYKDFSNKKEACLKLRKDILNSVKHVFGQHDQCENYFCTRKNEMNLMTSLSEHFINKIMEATRYIANHSKSLLEDVDSNIVEQFNSIVAKFIGGKRINYALKNSYQARCAAAVVSHNTKMPQSSLSLNAKNKIIRRIEVRRRHRVLKKRRNLKKCFPATTNEEKDYGSTCQQPDMSEDIYKIEKSEWMKNLIKTTEELKLIEKRTRGQAESTEWMELRRKLLTASNFARVCKLRKNTNTANTVKHLLYNMYTLTNAPSLKHGKNYEDVAKKELENLINKKIEPCGLFIDKTHFYLGASPDGIIDDDTIVEIKCPYTSFKLNLMPEEAVRQKKILFWKMDKNGSLIINKKHDWYYQIQGQLHVTNKKKCILGVWTGVNKLMIEYIEKDDIFWNNMEKKLHTFYEKCLVPEMIDPRLRRNMPIRNITLDMEKKNVEF